MKAYCRRTFSIQVVFCLFIFLDYGCKKFVQIAPPNTQLVTGSVFNNSSSATSALVNIYISMFNNGESYNISEEQGLLSDELTNYSTFINQIQYYKNSLLPLNGPGDWDNGYNYIYQANAVIAALQNNDQIPVAISRQLTGEAKFIRAFWHFYLTNMYGNIPIVTTPEYTINESLFRSPQNQVYAQITKDLLDAESLLNSNYVDATDTATSTQRTRPNQGSAEALLARVYLYRGIYDSAKAQASLVINNSNLYDLDSILSPTNNTYSPNSPFLINSTEAIWQLSTPLPNLNNTFDAQSFILFGSPNTGAQTFNSTTISSELLNSFEPGDLRKLNWIDSIVESGVAYYFPFKYQAVNTTQLTEYTMVLRLAEQYLIRAEAEAKLNDLIDGANDLNKIRNRAGLANISASIASSETTLVESIMHERQVELFAEWGHRWFDLVRTGTANSIMGPPGNVCQMKGGIWNPNSQLYPIPQIEIANDANLTQNNGYN